MAENRRREFIKNVGAGAAAVGVAGIAGALNSCNGLTGMSSEQPRGNTIPGRSLEWRMVSVWPAHFPLLGEGAGKFAQWVDEMSGGRLKIKVYGGGTLVPPLGVFDAVGRGEIEMGHGAAYYWAGKSKAAQFFASVPFGLSPQSLNTWLYSGGGMELWDEVYAPFNLKPFMAGNTGVQMGGWFNRKITAIEDFKGLKMKISGLGGKVVARAGGNPVLVADREILPGLSRGKIDAAEWIGPYHDLSMGFYKAARYYYYPGWQEPGTGIEAMVNLDAWAGLPRDLKAIVEACAYKSNVWMLSEFENRNKGALRELMARHHVRLRSFPDSVLKTLKGLSMDVLEEVAASDPMSRKVYDAFSKFRGTMDDWNWTGENRGRGYHAS